MSVCVCVNKWVKSGIITVYMRKVTSSQFPNVTAQRWNIYITKFMFSHWAKGCLSKWGNTLTFVLSPKLGLTSCQNKQTVKLQRECPLMLACGMACSSWFCFKNNGLCRAKLAVSHITTSVKPCVLLHTCPWLSYKSPRLNVHEWLSTGAVGKRKSKWTMAMYCKW